MEHMLYSRQQQLILFSAYGKSLTSCHLNLKLTKHVECLKDNATTSRLHSAVAATIIIRNKTLNKELNYRNFLNGIAALCTKNNKMSKKQLNYRSLLNGFVASCTTTTVKRNKIMNKKLQEPCKWFCSLRTTTAAATNVEQAT